MLWFWEMSACPLRGLFLLFAFPFWYDNAIAIRCIYLIYVFYSTSHTQTRRIRKNKYTNHKAMIRWSGGPSSNFSTSQQNFHVLCWKLVFNKDYFRYSILAKILHRFVQLCPSKITRQTLVHRSERTIGQVFFINPLYHFQEVNSKCMIDTKFHVAKYRETNIWMIALYKLIHKPKC